MKVPSKTIERQLFKSGYRMVIGVDEVGMGCLAGPVVVCAVAISPAFYQKSYRKLAWLRDSKLLTATQREIFSKELLSNPHIRAGVSFCYPETIDKVNISQAARLAMRRAVATLAKSKKRKAKRIVLIDGPHNIPGLTMDQMPIVRGDSKVFAIACASIIAKVRRDKMMARYAKKFPGYGLEQHKGYATKFHKARLAVLGPCEIHRRSFSPVANLV